MHRGAVWARAMPGGRLQVRCAAAARACAICARYGLSAEEASAASASACHKGGGIHR